MAAALFRAACVFGAAFSVAGCIACPFIGVTLCVAGAACLISCPPLGIPCFAFSGAFLGTGSLFGIFGRVFIGAALGPFCCAASIFSRLSGIFFFFAGILFGAAKFARAVFGLTGRLTRGVTFPAGLFFCGFVLSLCFTFS